VLTHDAPIVWGKDQYNQSGVVPYVHPEGARIPSLRRLYKKHPYFTNGSAKDLPSVLDRARFGDGTFWHETPDGQSDAETTRLDAREQKALLAFLDLL
jgi:cytochrome c peroxidase